MKPWYKDWFVLIMIGVMSVFALGIGTIAYRGITRSIRIERQAKDACSPYQVEHYWVNDDNELLVVCKTEYGFEVR